jgi:5-methylcytosine-specific restriction enzyme subunit McrC
LDVTLTRELRHRYLTFDSVASVEYLPGSIPELNFTRINRHWEVAARLAELILRQQSLRDRKGGIKGTTFTVDMNKLFERFVEEIVREEAQRAGYQLVPQAPRYLTKKIPIRPDLVLRRGGQDFAVADVKYKELEPEKWSHADLYQLLAYCVSLGLPAGLLIYASARPLERHLVHRAGVGLELVGIEMSSKPRDDSARPSGEAA